MTVQEYINHDMKAAMIAKNTETRNLLRVVIGEFNREGKTVSDDRALKIIGKMHQNAVDQKNTSEAKILNEYLPRQMGEEELTKEIQFVCNHYNYTTMRDMGNVMSQLKSFLGGRYDGKMASEIVKIVLTSRQIQ